MRGGNVGSEDGGEDAGRCQCLAEVRIHDEEQGDGPCDLELHDVVTSMDGKVRGC